MRGKKTLFSHESDEWETPQELFDELNEEFHFDLDACATAKNHKCAEYFSLEDDGLCKPWGARRCSVTRPTAA